MSLTHLLERFDAIGVFQQRMVITIDQTFTGSAELASIMAASLGQDSLAITVNTWERSSANDFLHLNGTANLLNIESAVVDLLATERAGELLLTLGISIPAGWNFSQSFPDLPGYFNRRVREEERCKPSFLNELSLGACQLIFTNLAHHNDSFKADLLPGLNFAGELLFMGALFGLDTLTGTAGPVFLSGPLHEYRSTPDPLAFIGVRLQSNLTLGHGEWPIPLKNPSLLIKSCLDDMQVDHSVGLMRDPGIYFSAGIEIAGRPAEIVAKYSAAGEDGLALSFYGQMQDFALAGFSSLSNTLGGGVESALPTEISAPTGLVLSEFGMSVNFSQPAIESVMVGLACQTHWTIIPDKLVIEEIGFNIRVANPFSSQNRRIGLGISGTLAIGDTKLVVYGDYPSYTLRAGLAADQSIALGSMLAHYFPSAPALPAMSINRLLLTAAPKAKTFSMACGIGDLLSIPVGSTAFELRAIDFAVNYQPSSGTTGAFCAEMTIAEATAIISGELSSTLTLSGSLQHLDLKKFWNLVSGGGNLPDAIPDLVFDLITLSVSPDTGAFSVLGSASIDWDYLSAGQPLTTKIGFSFSKAASQKGASSAAGAMSGISARISLEGTGPVSVAPGFDLDRFNLAFEYQSTTGWKLSGAIDSTLFDTPLQLFASVESNAASSKLLLQSIVTPEKTLINLPGIGSYSFKQFDLALARTIGADGKKQTLYDLRVGSTLKVDKVFTIGGYLGLKKTADGAVSLAFQPTPGSTAFSINFPTGEGMGIKAELFEAGFVKQTAAAGWSFSATVYLGFVGFPGFLGKALPSRVMARLVAGSSEVSISALNVSDPVTIPFPKAHGKSLGQAVVQLTALGITISPNPGLVIEAGLGLPAELNAWLCAQIFRVYQAKDVLSMARTRFSISGSGVAVQFLSSPFAAANAVVINNESWFNVDFGQYGAIALKMPTLVYDGVSQYFEAGGGFKITRTLALPLAPLKMFLEACGGKEMANIFPAKIPLEGIALVDANGDLKIDEFVNFVKKAGDVPKEVTSTLKKTGKVLNRFPLGFKQYLNLQVPDQLEFKFGFSPSGRISIGLQAPNKPVRVMFPALVQSYVPMPGLCGIELRKFSVGTIMAGSLLYGEIDATIDQFDLPSLIVSLALPNDPSFPLPTSDQLQRRITLDDVFCVIPVQAGEPIPIPLFYDEIGFDYLGVEGLGLGVHIGFPKPGLDGAAAMAVYQAFDDFTSNSKALLDPKKPPAGVDLKFMFHDEFLQAPEYLGGKVLGTKGKTISVSLWQYLAELMNFGKTFSITHLISSVPIENRVGSAQYRFAFMQFDADWLLTTPSEFNNGAFEKLKLSNSDRADFIAVLPAVNSSGGQSGTGEGLVAFVRGQADLGFVRLEAAFGLAASGAMGFNTGFKFDGSIGKVDLVLQGAVMVNAPLASNNATASTTSTASTGASKGTAAAVANPSAASVGTSSAISNTSSANNSILPGSRAVTLSGKNAWIEIPASDTLLLPEYTIELWLRSDKNQSSEWVQLFGIDTFENGLRRNYYLEINTKSGLYSHRYTDSSSANAGPGSSGDGSVRWGQWQHVAISNDGITARTFVDGKEMASCAVVGTLALLKAAIFIGKQCGPELARRWNGDLAEIRIWKCARSGEQIRESLREILQGDEQDLVSLYRFDGSKGNQAFDLCGRNHGSIKNGSFIDTDLLMFKAQEFDGKTDYIEIPDAASLRIGAYTLEAWIKPNQPVAGSSGDYWGGIAGKKGRNYCMLISRDGFVHHRFHTNKDWNDGIDNTANNVLQWNQWNHIAICNDGKTAATWVNGVKLVSGAVDAKGLIIDKESLTIGRSGSNGQEYFSGAIGEIRLWSGVRSDADLLANMTRHINPNSPNLVGLWRMQDVNQGILPDACGKNPGRYPNMAASRLALSHDGLVFDGSLDSASIAGNARFSLESYTIETWIRPEANPNATWQCILGNAGKGPKIYLNKNGIVSHRYSRTVQDINVIKSNGIPVKTEVITSVKEQVLNSDANQIQFGQWNHIAVSSDGKTCTLYVNGSQKAAASVPGKFVADSSEISLGRDGTGSFFAGSIDDLRFWSIARPANDIATSMNYPLSGSEPGLLAWYDMDHTNGNELSDQGPAKLHGSVKGARWALAAAPASGEKASIQILGHAQLSVLGHAAMVADLRLVDSTFWFSGKLDLFPSDWPIRVYGQVEGMFSKQRFYLSGATENSLFGLALSQSRLFLSNQAIRLEGRWLGVFTLLDIGWDKDDPHFTGSIGLGLHCGIDFGAVRIRGVKLSDNIHIDIDIGVDISVNVSKQGFAAKVHAQFQINGKGFDVSFAVSAAPNRVSEVESWVKQRIIDEPAKYLAHLFTDAATWLKNVGDDTIDFAKDAGEAVGNVLKSGFNSSKEQACALMKDAGYGAHQVGAALGKAYQVGAADAAKLLKGANYAVEDVGNALKQAYGHSAEDAAKVLKGIGYAAGDVNKALGSAWGKTSGECEKILKGAGYASKEVSNALGQAGSAVSSGVKKGWKKVKSWF